MSFPVYSSKQPCRAGMYCPHLTEEETEGESSQNSLTGKWRGWPSNLHVFGQL